MSLVPRLALLIGSVVLVLLLGEGVARVMAMTRQSGHTKPARSASDPPVLVDIMDLAKPNVRGVFEGVPYRTNSKGIRGPEYTPRPESGTFRILISGDSVTMGWGVAEDETYAKVLERMLNEASSDHPASGRPGRSRRVEAIQVGLAGVNADYSSQRIRDFASIYEPDITIYGFTLNDIEGPGYRKLPKEDRKALSQPTWRRALRFKDSSSYLLRELWPRWIMVREWDVFHPSEASRIAPQAAEWNENYFENPEAWGDFSAALDLHALVTSQRQICGHVLLHTYLRELSPEHRYRAVYDHVRDAATARGLSVTESFDYFDGQDKEELWLNTFDIHPNAKGHAILAQALYDGLRALPADCWKTRAE